MKKYRIVSFGSEDQFSDGFNPELLGAIITPFERVDGGYVFDPLKQFSDASYYCGCAKILAMPAQRTTYGPHSFSVGDCPFFAEVYLEELP